ncbi:MAG: HAD hydrolase-like protein [Lachnospiraceae bacterium]|nr:HAD hydrolase-like protein [Lachnospiraceae bacterium]
MKKYFLFDLDGTLTDPKIGICTCVQYALKDQGIEEPDLDRLEPFIGPPLWDSFMKFYGMDREQADKAVAKYRERFSDVGLFENEVYEGIPFMLKDLKEAGFTLAVASSKPTVYVERILEHFQIKQYFKVIVGSNLDGTRVSKDEVVREALGQLFGVQPIDPQLVYMIGDRCFDVEGAKALKVESVGVTYGYGSMEELQEAKADYIVRSVGELHAFLLREEERPKPKGFFQVMWPFLYPFLLFILIRNVVDTGVLMFFKNISGMLTGKLAQWLLFYDEATGEATGLTGNATAIMSALSCIVAIFFVRDMAKKLLQRTKEDMFLAHLRPEPPITYGVATLVTVAAVVGLNVLLEVMGVTDKAAAYQNMLADVYSASLPIGLICFGIIIPVVEEILFRGIIYNILRRRAKITVAMIISAFTYGMYFMNYIQGVYAFVMGCLMVYMYEYFGSFAWPVIVHVLSGCLVYLLTYTPLVNSPLYSLPVCLVCGICVFVGLRLLDRKKRYLVGEVVSDE